ncbi:MAG: hypothetical protein AAB632_02840 [Patescibacteria group bacterium]
MPAEREQFSKREIKEFEKNRIEDKEKAHHMANAEAPERDKRIEAAHIAERLGVQMGSDSTEGYKAAKQAGKEYDEEQRSLVELEERRQGGADEMIKKTIIDGTSGKCQFGFDEKESFARYMAILEEKIYEEVDEGEGGVKRVAKIEGFALKTDEEARTFELTYDNPLNK